LPGGINTLILSHYGFQPCLHRAQAHVIGHATLDMVKKYLAIVQYDFDHGQKKASPFARMFILIIP